MRYTRLGVIFFCSLLLLGAMAPAVATENTTQTHQMSETDEKVSQHTKYNIVHDVYTNETTVTVEIKVSDESESSHWSVGWSLPENATVLNTETQTSESVSINRTKKGVVVMKETDGEPRRTETFYLRYRLESPEQPLIERTQSFEEITQYTFRLTGMNGVESSAQIKFVNATHGVANALRYTNHSIHSTNDTVTIDGTGPLSTRINIKNEAPSQSTTNFAIYNSNFSNTTLHNTYAISTIGTGVIPQFHQVPVIVINETTYDSQFGTKIAGQYQSGVIYLSRDAIQTNPLPLLTHEYTHAITDRVSSNVTPRWFTEGASQYTESIAWNQSGEPQNELDEDAFREYYQQNDSWVIYSWKQGSWFAYDYAELIFKERARQTDAALLQRTYASAISGETRLNNSITPQVLYDGTWTGQVCSNTQQMSETVDCAKETLQYVPNVSQPDEYARPFGGFVGKNITIEEPVHTQTEDTQQDSDERSTPSSNSESTPSNTESDNDTAVDGIISWIIQFFVEILRAIWRFIYEGLVSLI